MMNESQLFRSCRRQTVVLRGLVTAVTFTFLLLPPANRAGLLHLPVPLPDGRADFSASRAAWNGSPRCSCKGLGFRKSRTYCFTVRD